MLTEAEGSDMAFTFELLEGELPEGAIGTSSLFIDNDPVTQMRVDMEMTKTQQQWTVISTALQLLDQMYSSAARGTK